MPSARVFSGSSVGATILNTSVTISGTVDGALVTQYEIASTLDSATKSGVLVLGVTATTARAIKMSADGAVFMTGTCNVGTLAALVAITPYRIGGAAIASGTGTGPLMMGMQLGATLARPIQVSTSGAMIAIAVITANAGFWNASVIATTSAAGGVIIKTSGAHTLYITDLLISVGGPMTATLCSETTALSYFAGLPTTTPVPIKFVTPMICTTAHSFRVICGSSGVCSIYAAGYTVT